MRRQVFDSANELNESLLYIDECRLSYAKTVQTSSMKACFTLTSAACLMQS